MSAEEECQELKNIKYKSVFLSSAVKHTADINGIEKILENESIMSKKEPWNKLDKTIKIKKISSFVDNILSTKHSLSKKETADIKEYLVKSLDRVKLQRAKDVDYTKETGKIKSIPNLIFNEKSRKFTLKRCEKRQSTLKSLGNPTALKKKKDKTKRNLPKKDKEKEKKDKRDKKEKLGHQEKKD
tara:strand:- start:5708 stop:6262 length:555 start_codon:yes stop_codon:yes gene_type:complete